MGAFNKQKHITYWLRCLKTFLPYQYTSMDTNRMMLAFFTISALDILDALDTSISQQERAGYIDWIYSLQHPNGGFRGSPALLQQQQQQYSSGDDAHDNQEWDSASVPSTYFALATLVVLKDDFARVRRVECLRWLKAMQRSDGSFGQTLGSDGSIQGGHDTRFSYLAVGIRWLLGVGRSGSHEIANGSIPEDLEINSLVRNIRQLQTYDGGFSDEPFHEAHGGYTYCAIAALATANRLDDGIADLESLIRWLVARQTRNLQPDEDEQEDCSATFTAGSSVSFNGRCNKIGDTCYVFWAVGALKSLGKYDLIDKSSATAYLIHDTQHFIGGFTKYPGDPPDIYHSYLGLAALGVLEHTDIQAVHPVACFSLRAVQYLEQHIVPQYQQH